MTTELLTDPGHTRGDLQMIRQAIRHGWEIPEQLLSALPKVAGAMALDKKEKSVTRLKAMETILKMKEANDRADGTDKPQTPPQPPQTTINVGVSVDNRTDTGRDPLLAIGERIQAARILRQPGG
jgi:hypothetical protein